MTNVIVVEVFVPNAFSSPRFTGMARRHSLVAVSRPWQVLRGHVGRAEVP